MHHFGKLSLLIGISSSLGCSAKPASTPASTITPVRNPPAIPQEGRKEGHQMELTREYLRLKSEWTDHCQAVQYSGNINTYLDCDAFRQIVALGPDVVPLIMKDYEQDQFVPWEFALHQITGIQMIDDPNNFDIEDARRRRLEWWRNNQ